MVAVIAVLFFASFALAGYAITATVRERNDAQTQLQQRLGGPSGAVPAVRPSVIKDLRLSSIDALNRFLQQLRMINNFSRLVRQAGIRRRVGEVFLLVVLIGAMAAMVGSIVTGSTTTGVIIGLTAALLPVAYLARMKKQRLAKFSEQLPDALDLVKAALQAGHSLPTALRVVADEFPPPISEEFETIGEEVRLGLPMKDALQGMTDRMPDDNLPVLTVGILVVQESGGNLAEVLGNVSHTVRERFRLMREVETMTAQGRLTGMLLTALPVLSALLMAVLVPGYFDAMLDSSSGRYLLAYAAGSIMLGHMIVQRLVKIRV